MPVPFSPLGGSITGRWRPLFLTAHLLYRFGLENPDGYRCGDAGMWGVAPGWLVVESPTAIALQANLSGRWHDPDRHQDIVVASTGSTEIFLGPQVSLMHRALAAEAGVDLPIWQAVEGTQLVSRYRLHLGGSWTW